MSKVYLSSSTNSQKFTTCCGVAICEDQNNCPECKEEVDKNCFGCRPQRPNRRERLELGLEE